MTMMRRCEACGRPIEQEHFIELTCRVLKSVENESQGEVEQVFADYCNECVAAGDAIKDLVGGLEHHIEFPEAT